MPAAVETKRGIENSLKSFADKPLVDAATALFESLGYKSQKRIVLKPNTAKTFTENFAKDKTLNPEHALIADWQSVDFLFQLTDDEVRAAAQGNEQFLFESKGKWNGAAIESYLFFAITLTKPNYTRTELSGITRAVNRLFPMPAMLLFRHGDTLTLAVINRRLHKRDESKDVLEKVTLIKDIRFANPHRAHVEILADLSFDALHEQHDFANFVELYAAWQKALDSSELNKRFFLEIANWYFWALNYAKFPKDAPKQNGKDHISVIRLITRLMFCWFVKEKGLIPDILFDERKLAQTLNGFAPSKTGDKESVFYKAILQNLFFATLNTEMDKRGWTKEEQNFMAHSLYRHRDFFQKPNDALDLFKNIPFLNGGLFECLDKDLGENAKPRYVRIDGFSRREDSQPIVPDFLFFGPEREVDLSEEYGDKKFKKIKVRGLIHTFDHYKFTVTENTPIEEEIALDPELSGKVFENLLAAYNPETGATARKQTGSFYTPREIVNYMVDEALIACLKTKLEGAAPSAPNVEKRLRHLFAYNDQPHQFTQPEVDALIAAIDSLKSIDPAVGSGAFPMGILHKLVFILGKLDPRNEKWKERQIARVRDTMVTAEKIEDATARERAVRELEQQIDGINEAFEHNELDYGRKLYLIENCIYGVDIQPIAVQIAKMRFFISLIVDQKIDDTQPNRGVRPLPNLETKFVAANTLIGVNRPGQQLLRNRDIDAKEAKLREVRRSHFLARSLTQKRKCREQDEKLRAEIAELLKGDGWDTATARRLADWNPYDQNTWAGFFDAEWMFGITDGFDISIGNPPYVRIQTLTQTDAEQAGWLKEHYASARKGNYDLYVVFVERGLQLLQRSGQLAFILPHKFFNAQYGEPLRKLLADGKNLRHVVHFGDQQIFPGATNYVCLLFLAKGGAEHCRWVRADDLPAWLVDGVAIEAPIAASRVTDAEWNFAVGKGAGLFERLQRMPVKLENIAARISQGIRTSANEVYVLDVISEKNGLITAFSKQLDREVVVEQKSVLRFLQGREIKAYSITPSGKVVLMPYELEGSRMALLTQKELKADFPRAWEYYMANKKHLEAREDGRMRNNNWYGFIYPKNLEVMFASKILVPDIADRAAFALDEAGEFTFTSGYGITLKADVKLSPKYLVALLNSRLLDSCWKRVSTPLRGGYFRYFTQFIEQLPIRPIDFAVASERAQHDALVKLVERILAAKEKNPAADTTTLEDEIDQQVYALYGLTPEEIKIVEDSSKGKKLTKPTV
jgi:type I restriction-modification system DNA methylase subunit